MAQCESSNRAQACILLEESLCTALGGAMMCILLSWLDRGFVGKARYRNLQVVSLGTTLGTPCAENRSYTSRAEDWAQLVDCRDLSNLLRKCLQLCA